jgi:hypothetical protein
VAHKLKDRVLVLDEMDAKRAVIAVVQAPVDWNGQAKQTLNPKPKLLPGQSSLEPSKSVSPSQKVMSQTLRRRLWGKDGSTKQSSEIGRVDAAHWQLCKNTGSCRRVSQMRWWC